MTTEERMLEVLKKTLIKIEELNTRIEHIEEDLTSMDQHQTTLNYYAKEIERVVENNNIMG